METILTDRLSLFIDKLEQESYWTTSSSITFDVTYLQYARYRIVRSRQKIEVENRRKPLYNLPTVHKVVFPQYTSICALAGIFFKTTQSPLFGAETFHRAVVNLAGTPVRLSPPEDSPWRVFTALLKSIDHDTPCDIWKSCRTGLMFKLARQ